MVAVTSLVVRLKTSGSRGASTDDWVYFGIGTREWLLDTDRDDFQIGATETFTLRVSPGLDTSHIQAIQLRKVSTDGWKPEQIEVFVNDAAMSGTPLYRGTIDMFLDGGGGAGLGYGLQWEAPDYTGIFTNPTPFAHATDPAVTSLEVEVKTAAGADAGTDDDIYFNVGTREWLLDKPNHNDFEPNQTTTYTLTNFGSLKLSHIRRIALRKEGDNGVHIEKIKVKINGTTRLDERVDRWLDGGSGAELQHGKFWASRNFPHPAPTPIEDAITELKVTLTTRDVAHAETSNYVYFNNGINEWTLGDPASNYGRNSTQTFTITNLTGVRLSDFRQLMIRKEGGDGWGIGHVKVEVKIGALSRTLYDDSTRLFLDGAGTDSSNRHGLYWSAADYVVRVPLHCHWVTGPVAGGVTPRRTQEASAEIIRNLGTAAYRQGMGASNGYWHQARVQFHVIGFTRALTTNANATVMSDTNDGFAIIGTIAAANNVANVTNAYFVRATNTGSNWSVPAANSVWVQDTRNGATVNTSNNFRMVAVSTAHELGHHFGLPHNGAQRYLMTGSGTNASSQLFNFAGNEDTTAHGGADTNFGATSGP